MVEEFLVFILMLFIHGKIQYPRNIKYRIHFKNEIQNKDQFLHIKNAQVSSDTADFSMVRHIHYTWLP